MKRTKQWQRTLKAASGACCALVILSGAAHAEIYQNVPAGQTLSQLASRFHLSVDALREANNLRYGDNDALPAMLLRIPDAATPVPQTKSTPAPQPVAKPAPRPAPQTSGSLTSIISYNVKKGDNWESITNFYARQGYDLSVDELKGQNPQITSLRPGTQLRIALTKHFKPAPGDSASIVSVASHGYDTAQVIAQPKPLYNNARPDAPAVQTQTARRGPANLASRGSFGMQRGVQVLGGSAQQTAPQSTFDTDSAGNKSYAKVVKVVKTGARIRRSPSANGTTLFVCPVGTKLAVTGHQGYWYSILMSDRSTGWLPAKYVEMQQQQVDTSTQVVTGSKAAQMFAGDGMQQVDGKLVSNNPFISTALTWMGTPYVYGGESRRGVDCSSFVQHVFSANGIKLPRTAAQQAKVGTPISQSDLQTGDRLYFSSSRTYIDHTGIYIGNGKFIHASGSRRGVTISDLSESFYQRIYVGARR